MSKDNEKRKSKYLRDSSDPIIKHLRTVDEPKSRYFKSSAKKTSKQTDDEYDEEEAHSRKEFRDSVITPKRAREQMLSGDSQKAEAEAAEPQDEEASEYQKSKGTSNDIFRETEINEEQKKSYNKEEADKSLKERRKNATIRMVLCMGVLTVIATILMAYPIRNLPYMPDILNTEFAALPELIASIAYGPVFGVIICIIKNLIRVIFDQYNFVSYINNTLLDSTFVFIAGLLYSRSMFSGDNRINTAGKSRDYRRKRIFSSCFAGAVISAVPQFFITRFIAYPLIAKVYAESQGITMEFLFKSYQDSYLAIMNRLPEGIAKLVPEMNSISTGILLYNLPITFIKLFIITVITAIIYKYISPFLHYRRKKKRKKHNH